MAVVENRASEIGDVMLIKAEAPVVGLIALSTFVDNTQNEDVGKFFYKEFRYSLDGIDYTDWIELTIPNISAVQVASTDTFFIEYRYTRLGTDPTNELIFDDVTVTGTYSDTVCGPVYDKSVFSKFFSCQDVCVLNWAINVLQKMYDQGIVPKYITRGSGATSMEDADYVAYWRTVSQFYAYLVCLARAIENFYSDAWLLNIYLNQFGTLTCGDESLDQLVWIMANSLRNRRYRGSVKMYEKSTTQGIPNGELLRLICWKASDEFIFGVTETKHVGWCIGNSSPMYRGRTGHMHLIKGYEFTKDAVDLTPYPLLDTQGTVQITTESSLETVEVTSVTAGEVAGIGDQDIAKVIVIDPSLNYEITFEVKGAEPVSFGCYGFDIAYNLVSFENIITGADDDFFFTEQTMGRSDKYYFVRGLIYNKDEGNQSASDGLTNLGIGNNLRFKSNVNWIIPYIVLDNTSGGGVSGSNYFYDVKVRPSSLPYTSCFLNNGKFIDSVMENNNGSYTDAQITDIMRRQLIPYNTSFKNTFV